MIPNQLYQQILENMPILCIDFVLENEGKVLLTYRTEEPAKDQWWIQGGRVHKNEKLIDAVRRKAKDEIGIDVDIVKIIGTYEIMFEKGAFNLQVHDVAVCFLVKPKNGIRITLDATHQKYKWISKIEEDLHPYVKEVLDDSKVFQ
ncbi:MAG TPA: NUDIX domain-containing protein [Candidatus Nanoarchaeia archaeon]|nr:NUDIX domain-containing protein [Candidatus Nanoarchaeia archaeon]